MASTLEIAGLIAVPTGLFVGFLRMPNWLSRSLHRHRLWRERDAIVDEMIDGRLPKDHAAVRDLLWCADWVIEETSSITMVHFWVWSFVMRRVDPEVRKAMMARSERLSLEGLTDEERARVCQHHERLRQLSIGSVLSGSWLGILTILRFLPRAIVEARRMRVTPSPPKVTVIWNAADRASTDTWVGRRSEEFISAQDRLSDQRRKRELTGVA